MKKILKRVALLLCIITLFTIPLTAFASTQSQPVLETYEPSTNFKSFVYKPSPLTLLPKSSTVLPDTTNGGSWFVPSGERFVIAGNLGITATLKVEVFKQGSGGGLVYSNTVTDSIIFLELPALQTSASYFIQVTNVGTANAFISDYTGFSQP